MCKLIQIIKLNSLQDITLKIEILISPIHKIELFSNVTSHTEWTIYQHDSTN